MGLEVLVFYIKTAILFGILGGAYYLYSQIIKPALTIAYYKRQGCLHVKLAGLNVKKDLQENAKKYGDGLGPIYIAAKTKPDADAIILQMGSQIMIQITSPKLIKEFYAKELQYYKTSASVDIFGLLVGDAILFQTGEPYKKHRKLLAKPFHFDFLKYHVTSIENQAIEYCNEIAEGNLSAFRAQETFRRFMGGVATYILLGENVDKHILEGKPAMEFINDTFDMIKDVSQQFSYTLFGLKFVKAGILPSHARVLERCRLVYQTYHEIYKRKEKEYIDSGKNVPEDRKNLLQFLVDAKTNQSEVQVTDEMVVGRFMDMTIAGMENTGKSVALALCYLHFNPEMKKKLMEEINEYWPKGNRISIEVINACKYLHAFIKEVLRFGTNFGTSLDATQTHKLGNITIRKDQFVGVSFAFMHANPKFYQNPLEFDPERYIRKSKSEGHNEEPFAWLPFGSGPRNCLGQNLALLNIKIMLLYFLRRFDFELPKDYKLKFTISLTRNLMTPPVFKLKPLDA